MPWGNRAYNGAVQAVVSMLYDKDKLPFHKADQLITDALEAAEVHHQQLVAMLDARQRAAPDFKELFPQLKSLVDAKLGAHDTSEGPDVSAELTRALAYLWLYFDEECAYRAAEVCLGLSFISISPLSAEICIHFIERLIRKLKLLSSLSNAASH